MSELTDADLESVADYYGDRTRTTYDSLASRVAREALRLRAVVGAQATAARADQVRRLAVEAKAGRTPETATWQLADRILDVLGEPGDPATRFHPGDRITVGTRQGEYVSYAGGQFHTHRYRVVWPDGDRSTDVFTATDREVSGGATAPRADEDGALPCLRRDHPRVVAAAMSLASTGTSTAWDALHPEERGVYLDDAVDALACADAAAAPGAETTTKDANRG